MEMETPTLTFGLGYEPWAPNPPCLLALDIEEQHDPALQQTFVTLSLIGSPQQLAEGAGILHATLLNRGSLTLAVIHPDGSPHSTPIGVVTHIDVTGLHALRPGRRRRRGRPNQPPALLYGAVVETLRCTVALSSESFLHNTKA